MIWILLFLLIVAQITAAASTLRETPEGEKAINIISKSGLSFLKWRATPNYRKELVVLRNIFGLTVLVFIILNILFPATKYHSNFGVIPGIFVILWLTLQIGTDFKKSVAEYLQIVSMFAIAPWILLCIDFLPDFRTSYFLKIAELFTHIGINNLENYQIAALMSLLGGFIALVAVGIAFVIFATVPLFFVFLIVVMSVVSKALLSMKPKTIKNLAFLYSYVLGPLLMTLVSERIL